jgi:cell pole-organizing protein PopZ
MAEGRPLVEGLKPVPGIDPAVEAEFVFKGKPKADPAKPADLPAAEARGGEGAAGKPPGRAPLTTRIRTDFAAALKRASLERQLNGVSPHTLQDILEEALQPWLRANGYLN